MLTNIISKYINFNAVTLSDISDKKRAHIDFAYRFKLLGSDITTNNITEIRLRDGIISCLINKGIKGISKVSIPLSFLGASSPSFPPNSLDSYKKYVKQIEPDSIFWNITHKLEGIISPFLSTWGIAIIDTSLEFEFPKWKRIEEDYHDYFDIKLVGNIPIASYEDYDYNKCSIAFDNNYVNSL